jgi:quinol monooxygenase YgiN
MRFPLPRQNAALPPGASALAFRCFNLPHAMSIPANLVTIHPYFKTHPGKQARAEALLEKFVEQTRSETACLFYEFTVSGDMVFCREGYEGAGGVMTHLGNVGELLKEMLTMSDLTRLEFHGPAEEIDQLRGPLGHLNPTWFVLRCGVQR